MRSIITGLVVLVCLASASEGFADNAAKRSYKFALPASQKAREHLNRGFRLYNNQDFRAAIDEFKAGVLVEQCSCFDYDLGQSYRQLGMYKEALWHYQRFLNVGNPTGEVLEAVQKWITEMQAHLADAARTMPPTEAAPPTPPEPSPASTASRATASPTQAAAQPDPRKRDAPPGDDRSGSVSWFGWTATIGGVAALGTTGYLFLRASSLDDQGNKSLDHRMRNDLHDQASARRTAGVIVGVAGAALTATGVYLVIASRHHDRSTTASLDVGLTGRGVIVFGRF